ncbi:MAG: hydroxymethylglutaryl-CoA lyase [Bacteroidota bacterium]
MNRFTNIKLIECPRDAIQGIDAFIPTQKKINYLNYLLSLNVFDTIDFGSFVSPKLIPQMADTATVIRGLNLSKTNTKLLAIVANERGAEEATQYDSIQYLGYPFSISETFQIRNTNATIEKSVVRLRNIQNICIQKNKQLVVYISMAFGNPYQDRWDAEIVMEWLEKLKAFDIQIFSLSDTVGVATIESINYLCSHIIPYNSDLEIGLHLHTESSNWKEKIEAALYQCCSRFDGAILGYGGCPMAQDELVGNMPMENLLAYFKKAKDVEIGEMIAQFNELIT